jgi:hypothetical protein
MYFLIDDKKKLIFGWSAKCGCSFIKRLFYEYQGVNVDHLTSIHTGTYNWLHPYQFNYSKVLFIRNPYKRIVSGFVDKYCIRDFHLNIELLTFEKFIHEFF